MDGKLLHVNQLTQSENQPGVVAPLRNLPGIGAQRRIRHAGILVVPQAVLKCPDHSKQSLDAPAHHGNKQLQHIPQPFSADANPVQFRIRGIPIQSVPELP